MCAARVDLFSSFSRRSALKASTALALLLAAPAAAEDLLFDTDTDNGGVWVDDNVEPGVQSFLFDNPSPQPLDDLLDLPNLDQPDVFTSNEDNVFFSTFPTGLVNTVEIGTDVKPNAITFVVTGYSIDSEGVEDNAILIDDDGLAIDVVTGTATILVDLETEIGATNPTITVNGNPNFGAAGTLVLNNDNTASTSTLSVDAGTLELQGNWGGAVTLNGGDVAAESGLISGTTSVVEGTLTLSGSTFATDAVIAVGAGTVMTPGELVVEEDTDVDITTDGSVTVNSAITLTGTIGVGAGGSADIQGIVTDTVTNNGGQIDLNGGNTQAVVDNNTGTVAVIAASDGLRIDNSATLNVQAEWDGDISQDAGTTTLTGDVTGSITLTGGTLDANSGIVSGSVTVGDTAAPLDAEVLAGGTQFNGGLEATAGGTITVDGDTTANVTNNGGTVQIDNLQTLTGTLANNSGDTTIDGTITGNVTMGGAVGDVVANNGIIDGTLGVSGGTFDDEAGGGAQVTGAVTNTGGVINHRGGSFDAGITNTSGNLNVLATNSTDIQNNGGTVAISSGVVMNGTFSSTDGTTNNAGTINNNLTMSGANTNILNNNTDGVIAGDLSIAGSAIVNNVDGAINGAVNLTGGALNANGGTFAQTIVNSGGSVTINALTATDVRNESGATVIAGTGTVQGEMRVIDGTTANNGTVDGDLVVIGGGLTGTGDVTGFLNITGGNVDLDGGQIGSGGAEASVTAGIVSFAGVTFDNGLRVAGGSVSLDGNVTGDVTSVGTTTTLQAGNTLTGNVTVNGGTFVGNGLVSGNADLQTGNLTLDGGVNTGAVTASGGNLTISGGVYANQVSNTGADAVISGGTFTNGVLNQGAGATTDVTGIATGDFTVNGGALTVTNRINGDVTQQAGQTNQNGRVTGNVVIQSGIYNMDSQTDGTVTLQAGTLNADGATFGSGLTAVTGNVELDGTNSGNVVVSGADIDMVSGGRLNGNMTVNTGTLVNSGVLNGQLTMNGGDTSNASGGSVLGAAVLAGGTLNADGGSFDGGLTLNSGTFNLNADTDGDITNNLADFTVTAGRTLGGDLAHNTGNLTLDGRVEGQVVVGTGTTATVGTGAVVTEDMQINNASVTVAGGRFNDGVVLNGGDLGVTGDMDGDITATSGVVTTAAGATIIGDMTVQGDGDIDNSADVTGQVTVTDGRLINRGVIDGSATVTGGTLNVRAGSEITGAVNVTGGRYISRGGDVGRRVNNDGGTVIIREDTAIDGTSANSVGVVNTDGRLDVETAATLTADVQNDAGATFDLDGDLDGNLENAGLVRAQGDIDGDVVNSGIFRTVDGGDAVALTLSGSTVEVSGSFTNTGEVEVADANLSVGDFVNSDAGATVTISGGHALVSGGAVNFEAGTLTIDNGGLEGVIDLDAGVTASLTDAELEGQVTSSTTITTAGLTTLASGARGNGDLTLDGSAELDVTGGQFRIDGDLNAASGTSITVADNARLRTGGFLNEGTTSLGAGSRLDTGSGGVNTGTIVFDDGAQITGNFRNASTIRGTGTLSFSDRLNGGGRVNVANNDSTSDRIEIGGDLRAQTFNVDIDVSGTTGTADQIVMNGDAIITGTVQLNFNIVGSGGEQDQDVVIIDASSGQDPSDYNISFSGLQGAGEDIISVIEYGVTINDQGDTVVFDALSPGIGSIAGNIVLAQSLIGSVINRPSSPFVSGLAFEDENPCGVGVWSRAIGGQADGNGRVEQESGLSFDGTISANYSGVQIGGDYACFNGFYDGWDLAFGGIAGANFGQSSQPVFALNPTAESGLSDFLLSTTDVDFTQMYGGLYVAAVRDALAVDLQYRVEKTDFTATNTGVDGGTPLGLNDEKFSSNARTLSGAVSYAFPLPDYNITIVPTAGFAYTQVETDPINFEGLGVLEINDFDSRTAFVGATVSRTRFGSDGVSALTQFGTATLYNDFASSPVSTFTVNDDAGNPTDRTFRTTTENLGFYGEISAGLNYTRILQPGEFGAAKQFNASLRSDIRVSDQLDSWGVTAQARIQF